jgi:hypothetical protein
MYMIFIFHPILIHIFSLNWLHWELLVECWQISFISYGFGDKKASAKAELQSFNFLFFPQILMQFFANWTSLWGYWRTINGFFFYLKMGSKGCQILKFAYLVDICNFYFSSNLHSFFFLWIDLTESFW